jgi:hypothetical protein
MIRDTSSPHQLRAGFLLNLVLAASASAGTQVGSGSTNVWGRPTAFVTWDVASDSGFGLVGLAEGRARDMAWWNGRLYCGGANDAQDAGPWYYTPGAAGSLASPNEINLTFTSGDSRRWLNNATLAINTSGSGFGAFAAGSVDPTLALVGRSTFAPSAPRAYTLSHSGSAGSMSGTSTLPSSGASVSVSLHYDAVRDRFVSLESPLGNPSQTLLRTYPHTAAGLLTPDTSITINENGLNGFDRISASFASLMTNGAVQQGAYLTVRREALGSGGVQVELLMLSPDTGSVLSRTALPLPSFAEFDPSVSKASAIAVDEAGGRVFVSDSSAALIYVLSVPTPGAGAAMALIGAVIASRRRR